MMKFISRTNGLDAVIKSTNGKVWHPSGPDDDQRPGENSRTDHHRQCILCKFLTAAFVLDGDRVIITHRELTLIRIINGTGGTWNAFTTL